MKFGINTNISKPYMGISWRLSISYQKTVFMVILERCASCVCIFFLQNSAIKQTYSWVLHNMTLLACLGMWDKQVSCVGVLHVGYLGGQFWLVKSTCTGNDGIYWFREAAWSNEELVIPNVTFAICTIVMTTVMQNIGIMPIIPVTVIATCSSPALQAWLTKQLSMHDHIFLPGRLNWMEISSPVFSEIIMNLCVIPYTCCTCTLKY